MNTNFKDTDDLFSVLLGSSVCLSVCHTPVTDELTNVGGVGVPVRLQEFTPAQRAFVGDSLAQIVGEPLREVQPVAQLGRVIVISVTPIDFADPVLPLLLCYGTRVYYHHYHEYWRALMARTAGWPVSRRRFRSLARRISLTVAPMLTLQEHAWFDIWLGHGVLGEIAWG